jgi:hypothetical protein
MGYRAKSQAESEKELVTNTLRMAGSSPWRAPQVSKSTPRQDSINFWFVLQGQGRDKQKTGKITKHREKK